MSFMLIKRREMNKQEKKKEYLNGAFVIPIRGIALLILDLGIVGVALLVMFYSVFFRLKFVREKGHGRTYISCLNPRTGRFIDHKTKMNHLT